MKIVNIKDHKPSRHIKKESLLCSIGLHRWQHKKSFYTNIIDHISKASIGAEESFRGFECRCCGFRKIKNINKRPAMGVVDNANNWLSE